MLRLFDLRLSARGTSPPGPCSAEVGRWKRQGFPRPTGIASSDAAMPSLACQQKARHSCRKYSTSFPSKHMSRLCAGPTSPEASMRQRPVTLPRWPPLPPATASAPTTPSRRSTSTNSSAQKRAGACRRPRSKNSPPGLPPQRCGMPVKSSVRRWLGRRWRPACGWPIPMARARSRSTMHSTICGAAGM